MGRISRATQSPGEHLAGRVARVGHLTSQPQVLQGGLSLLLMPSPEGRHVPDGICKDPAKGLLIGGFLLAVWDQMVGIPAYLGTVLSTQQPDLS